MDSGEVRKINRIKNRLIVGLRIKIRRHAIHSLDFSHSLWNRHAVNDV
jgi:hypothetical protein